MTFTILKSVRVKLPKNIFFNPEVVDDNNRKELSNSVSIIYKLLIWKLTFGPISVFMVINFVFKNFELIIFKPSINILIF